MDKWDESSRWDARKFSRHYLGPQPAAVNDLIGEAYRIGFRAGLEAAAGVVRRNCAGYLPDGARCGDDVLLNPDSMDGYTETARCEACDAAADIRAIPDPET